MDALAAVRSDDVEATTPVSLGWTDPSEPPAGIGGPRIPFDTCVHAGRWSTGR